MILIRGIRWLEVKKTLICPVETDKIITHGGWIKKRKLEMRSKEYQNAK